MECHRSAVIYWKMSKSPRSE